MTHRTLLILALLALSGCSGPPYQGGTLVVNFDGIEQTAEAASWWNARGGDWRVESGSCSVEPCVTVSIGDCAEAEPVPAGESQACTILWPDSAAIEIQPVLLARLTESGGLALCLAHEIGHVMGRDHSGPGTVMAARGEDAAWAD